MLDFITPFVGLVAAVIAVATLPAGKRDPGGVILPLIIGIGGAIFGRYIFAAFAYGPVQNLSREFGQPFPARRARVGRRRGGAAHHLPHCDT